MQFGTGIEIIRNALRNPLPGVSAQHLMAPKLRKTTAELLKDNKSYRLSSVLILLYPDESDALTTILIERPVNDSVHSGQIAFPGGKMEKEDPGPAQTALRETEEEIGVPANEIQVLGALSHLFIPASNFLVIPHLGFMDSTPQFRPSEEEVKSLIPFHVAKLLQLKSGTREFRTSYGPLQAPYYDLKGHAVWGATAMMISEFRELVGKSL